jgi:hypothetical protein
MPFCTKCGASVAGAFCGQCGTPVGAAAGQSAPASAPAPPSAAPIPPANPGARRTSPVVWVLVALLGVVMLGGLAVAGLSMFVVHKARQAGISADLWRRNPAAATARALALANRDIEIVSEDDGSGTVTVRDRSTGKTTTWNLDQARRGRISITAEEEDGKNATVDIGSGSTHSLPSWLPSYPGVESHDFAITGRGSDGAGGTFSFSTSDAPSEVLSFYQDHIKTLRMRIQVNAATPQGGVITATDDTRDRTLNIVVGQGSGKTTVNVTYGSKS